MEVDKEYLLNQRDQAESERLKAQHLLATDACGGRLVFAPVKDLVGLDVLDIGTANGEFLTAVSEENKDVGSLTGFDLSDALFPSNPGLIKFKKLDITVQPIPAEYVSKFDIINMRFTLIWIPDQHWSVVLNNCFSMLKPGGWIQFVDPIGYMVHPKLPRENPLEICNATFLAAIQTFSSGQADKVYKVCDSVKAAGFEQVSSSTSPFVGGPIHPNPALGRIGFYGNGLSTLNDTANKLNGLPKDDAEYDEIINGAIIELQERGNGYDIQLVTGQKPV